MSEVPGLAEAMRRPGVNVEAELQLTDAQQLHANIVLPDVIGSYDLNLWIGDPFEGATYLPR